MYVNTKLFSPVIIDGYTRANPLSYEYREWWHEQKRRCLEGYTVGGIYIPGDYYWYLNFWKIRGKDPKTGRKTLIAPRFVDMDLEYFLAVEKARNAGKHLVVVKARQKGFSEKHAALLGKEFTFFAHSQSIITAGEEKYSNATMRMCIRGLNALKDTEFYKRRQPDTLEYVQAKYKIIENGIPAWKGIHSEIYNMTSKNNAQATIGKSPSLIVFEEAGKFPGLIDSFKYIQPALEAEGGEKTGFAIIVGTGGDMEKGAAELEQMFYNPEAYDMMSYKNEYEEDGGQESIGYFVPAWKFKMVDSEGNSLKEESINYIGTKRETARTSKKAQDFINAITQDPLVPSEAFMRTGGNMFNAAILNTQYARLRNEKALTDMADRGRLEWIKDDLGKISGVRFIHDENGALLIFEHPDLDENDEVYLNLYVAGTDSYDKDEANTSDSKGSCSIYKMFKDTNSTSNMFAARYTDRPATADKFYEETAKLCMYYKSPNLIEWSNVGIFNWYKNNGFEGYLKERPAIAYANVKDSKVNNKYGVDPGTKLEWLIMYRDYIEQYSEIMYDPYQIDRAIKFKNDRNYNCDVTISSSLAVCHARDNINIKINQNQGATIKEEFFHYKSNQGKIQQHY
jgi:hypothetical protein